MALEKQPQDEISCCGYFKYPQHGDSKWTAYNFSNLLIRNTRNVGLIKNNGKAHLFLQELLEWHLELHFIFFTWHLHFL